MTDAVDSVTQDKLSDDDYGKSTPELDNEAILTRIKEWWREDYPLCKMFHQEASEAFEFKAGDGGQWSKEDRSYLEDPENQRVFLEFNRIEPIINAVVGAEITNRQEVRYLPRQVGDAPVNEVLTEAARWFRDECDAEHEESNGFADAVTCGMGWIETRLNYEDNPDGQPEIKRRDPMEMFWDASARQSNLTDSRRIYRVRFEVPMEEAEALFPTYPDGTPIEDDDAYDATWAAVDKGEEEAPYVVNRPQGYSPHETDEGNKERVVTLVQIQWWERQDYYRAMALDPMTGQQRMEDLEPEQHFMAQQRAQQMGVPYRAVKQTRKCFYEAFAGKELLSIRKLTSPAGKHQTEFNFTPITGQLDRKKGFWYGLVRPMKGPQRFANKWLTTTAEIMARGAKGGLLLEAGTVEDVDDFERDWAKPGANSYFKKGALAGGAVQPKPPPTFPSDFMQMTQFAISSIRDCTGVSVEMLGMAEQDQPASLEYQRRQSSTTILAPLFDSLRRYRRIEGRMLLFLITEYLTDNRLIRITGDEGEQYVPLTKQPGVTEYDVIVDDAPSSPAQKEMVWQSMVQMTPLITQLQPPPEALMALLEYSPLPASVVSKIKQAINNVQQNAKPPPSPAELKAQEKQIEMQASVQMDQQELAHKEKMGNLEFMQKQRMAELDFMAKRADKTVDHQFHMQQANADFQRKQAMQAAQPKPAPSISTDDDLLSLIAKEAGRRSQERETQYADNTKNLLGSVGQSIAPIADAVKELAQVHAKSTQALQNELRKPRKRTLVRGKDGRSSHAIDEVLN